MINELKQNKIIKIIFSILFSIMLLLDNKLVYNGNMFSNINNIYFKNINIKDIIFVIPIIIITYIFVTLLKLISDKYEVKNRNKNDKKIFFIAFIFLIICWLPYILSYFPFGIFSDTSLQIRQAYSGTIDNRHPLFGTLIIKLFIDIGLAIKDLKLGIQLYSIFQLLLMSSVISYFIYWLHKKNISKIYIIMTIIFYGFFKLIPLYVVSFWKDTIFSLALFLYIIDLADISLSKGERLADINSIFKHALLIFLVAFLRNNGIYIIILTTLSIYIIYRKNIMNKYKKFLIATTFEIILFIIVQGPLYSYANLSTNFVENVGIPLQQISYVVADNGNIDNEEKKFFNNIIPIETLKEVYAPANSDAVKFDEQFNDDFLNQNEMKFIEVWFQLLLKNPDSYIKAYLLNTFGYWDINKHSSAGYQSATNWYNVEERLGLTQDDYIENITGKSIRKYLEPKSYLSTGIFVWIMLLAFVLALMKKKNILPLIPLLASFITILIAVPLAFTFRYLYILTLALPFIIIINQIKENNN